MATMREQEKCCELRPGSITRVGNKEFVLVSVETSRFDLNRAGLVTT